MPLWAAKGPKLPDHWLPVATVPIDRNTKPRVLGDTFDARAYPAYPKMETLKKWMKKMIVLLNMWFFQILCGCFHPHDILRPPFCGRKNVSTARWLGRSHPRAPGLRRCPARHGPPASTWCSPKVPRSERGSFRSASTGGLKRWNGGWPGISWAHLLPPRSYQNPPPKKKRGFIEDLQIFRP